MKSLIASMAYIGLGLAGLPVCANPSAPSLRDALNQNKAIQKQDRALITNTGSTNTDGYMASVHSDGTVQYANHYLFYAVSQALDVKSGHISQPLTKKFFQDVKAAQPFSALPVVHGAKSVSFGTSTYVLYDGQMTPDLSSPADARGQALAADVKTITATLGLKNLPRRPVGPTPPAVPGH